MTVPLMAGSDRARDALPVALQLVGEVRDGNPQAVQRVLEAADLPALCVILAAMVDDTRRPSDLLAWAERQVDLDGWSWEAATAAHKRYEQLRARGQLDQLSEGDRHGQRVYDRVKHRELRARRAAEREDRRRLATELGITA